ncbi:MAG: hypothetical protein R3D00_08500 [Bacteroidia bacterium]
MLKKLINIIWKAEGQEDILTPINQQAKFELRYESLVIGILQLKEGIWTFSYSIEFRNQNKIKPLTDFPDIEKVYQSEDLYPFFIQRIPGLNQPKVKVAIEVENIDKTNEAELLKRFGQYSIANPFRLVVA